MRTPIIRVAVGVGVFTCPTLLPPPSNPNVRRNWDSSFHNPCKQMQLLLLLQVVCSSSSSGSSSSSSSSQMLLPREVAPPLAHRHHFTGSRRTT
mmetsp:Transcript_10460/g.14440  ORF Transcript_10460/g.14440 Transcript_10460/m.14440 type:complete len:94 (-) Transcript_10460:235-516(-)